MRSRELSSSARSSGSSPSSASSSRAPSSVVGGAAVLARQPGGRLELAVGAAGRGVPLAVADHGGVRQLGFERGEALQDLGDEVVDHRLFESRDGPAHEQAHVGRRLVGTREPRATPLANRDGRRRALARC